MLSEAVVTTVLYNSERTGDFSSRVIIPVSVPVDVVKAIDVDGLSPQDRANMAEIVGEYLTYRQTYVAGMFGLEDWAEQTKGVRPDPKWRTFKLTGLS